MPRSSHGNIIITSRNEETRHYGPRSNMDVSSFSETEATDLLLSASMLDIADEENRRLASEISRKLGNLPLAIMQAGAYIATHGELATYLTAYEKKRMELWNAKLDQSVDDYAYTVYTTWEMSMNMLAAPAHDFLRVCSFFHNVGISTDMFRTPFEIFRSLAESMLRNAATVNPTLPFVSESIGQFVTHPSFKNTMEFLDRFADSDGEWHPLAFGNLMGALRRYSMISGSGQHLYSIHSLVHQWTRFRTPDEEKDNYRGIALNIISGISFGSHYRLISLLFLYDLLPHLDAVLSIIELEGENLLLSHLLCLRHAFCRCEKWPSVEKIDLLGLRIVEHLPEDDPNRLYHQSLLVQSLFYMGKLEQSEALVVDTYEKSRQCNVLGPNHELTISCLSNQAMVVEQQGRWKDAGMLQARVLTAMLSNSSRETNIIKAMGNLACSLHRFGAYMQAEALRIVVFFVGYVAWTQDQCNEADVLVSMTNLSITLQRLRRNIPVEYCLKAIRRYGKIAGHTHPSCLETIFQIAALYSGSNQHNLAEAILHYSEKSILEVWGPESSQAILLKIHLATAHVGQGKLERAISELTPLFVRLSKTEAQLDVDRLLTTAFNLGIVLEVKGLLKQAEEVYQNVINRLEALSDQNLIYVTIEDQLRSVQDRISAGITEDAADSAGHTQPVRMEETLRQYSREDVEKLFSDDAENETLSYEDLLRECLKMRPDVVALIRRNECDTIQLCRLVFAA